MELSDEEVARNAAPHAIAVRWRVEVREPHRLGADYARLQALLVNMGPPISRPNPGHSHHTA